MDLRLLRYFVAVAEELHFGRAAARLHMTQPPLSRAVQQLETDLGCALLHRSPAGVALTPAGATLYEEARALLARAARVRTKVAAAAGTPALTVGTLADSAEQVGA
ncbi:LysR family transcriptional regulator, partial [Streptomyces varsoviensis]